MYHIVKKKKVFFHFYYSSELLSHRIMYFDWSEVKLQVWSVKPLRSSREFNGKLDGVNAWDDTSPVKALIGPAILIIKHLFGNYF
jgi:hypothetical protein